MFFALGPQQDPRFPYHDKIDRWIFSHDAGWLRDSENQWLKGYNHPDINYGLYTRFRNIPDEITIEHGTIRGYPLWYDNITQVVTNMLGRGQRLWADDQVTLTSTGIVTQKKDLIGDFDPSQITEDQAVQDIMDLLLAKTRALAADAKCRNLKLFLSGGTDTFIVWGLTQRANLDCDLVDYEYFKYDQFTNHNIGDIKRAHWAYRQLHHWTDPTVLLTGSCGDEFLFRGPNTVSLWCAWHDIDLISLLRNSQGYHRDYFLKAENAKIILANWQNRRKIRTWYPSYVDLVRQIINTNVNDHQHWHLGHTLTWTPFMDAGLTKIMLRLPHDVILDHIQNARVSKRLINELLPDHAHRLSDSKNIDPRKSLSVSV